MTHSATCTGCPHCSSELRALLSATPEETCAWLTRRDAELQRSASRALSAPADCAAPTPWQRQVERLRAAEATEPSFEDAYRARRQREFDAEHRRLDAEPTPRVAAAEPTPDAAPRPWSLALAKQKEGEQ